MKINLKKLLFILLAWSTYQTSLPSSASTFMSGMSEAMGMLNTMAQNSNSSNTTLTAAQSLLQQPMTTTTTSSSTPTSFASAAQGLNSSGLVGALVSGLANVATSSAGGGSGTGSQLASVLGSVATNAMGATSGSSGGGLAGMAQVMAQALLEEKQVATAAATFLINLPTVMLNVFQNFSYGSQTFQMLSPVLTDAGQQFGLQLDFGFTGAGDVNQPLNFVLNNGLFYYSPIQSTFLPSPFMVKDSTGALVASSSFNLFDPKEPYLGLITSILALAPGGVGTAALAYFKRLYQPAPADVYLLKTLLLIFTAAKNEAANAGGYPTLASLPLEYSILSQRLAKTPDITACEAKFPGVTDSSQWDPMKIVYIKSNFQSTINSMPSFIQSRLNQVSLPLPSTATQEMADLQNKGLLPGFDLYGQLRAFANYDDASDFIGDKILSFVSASGATSTKTEMNKLAMGVLTHLFERLQWIQVFLFTQFLDLNTSAPTSMNANIDISSIDMEMVGAKLATIDHTALIAQIDTTFSKLSTAITAILPALTASGNVSQPILDNISEQNQLLTSHKSEIENGILDAIKQALLITSDPQTITAFTTSYGNLKTDFDSFNTSATTLVNNLTNTPTVNTSLTPWMTYWSYKLGELSYFKFDGDRGYYKDDSQLTLTDSINQFMAIAMRGMSDLNKATELFKNDNTTMFSFTSNGATTPTSCATIYTQTVTQPQTLLTQRQQESAELTPQTPASSSTTSSTTTASTTAAAALLQPTQSQISTAAANLASATQIEAVSKLTFLSYLRQYMFDRRDTSGSFATSGFDPSTIANVQAAAQSASQAAIDSNVRALITQYNFTGANAQPRINALSDYYRMQAQVALSNNPTATAGYNTTITNEQAKITTNQTQLSTINSTIQQLQAKLATAGLPATTATSINTMIATLTSNASTLTAAIATSNTNVATAQTALSTAQSSVSAYNSLMPMLEQIAGDVTYAGTSPSATVCAGNPTYTAAYAALTAKITDPVISGSITKLGQLCAQNEIAFFLKTTTTQEDMDSVLIQTISSMVNQIFGFTSNTPTSSSIADAKTDAIALYSSVDQAQATFDSVTQDFIASETADTNKLTDLRGTTITSLWPSLARCFIYGLQAICSSPIGLDLENYLQQNNFFKTTTLDTVLQGGSSATSALAAAQLLLSNSSSGAYSSAVVSGQANFATALASILADPDLWLAANTENWTPSYFSETSVLPLDSLGRITFIQNTITSQLSSALQNMTADQGVRDRLTACLYMFVQYCTYIVTANTSLLTLANTALTTELASWLAAPTTSTSKSTTTTAGTAGATISQGQALTNLQNVLYWINLNMKYLMFYYKYSMEVAIKTSIQSFLIGEIAALSMRNSQIAAVMAEDFDPFLESVFGINSAMLLSQSQAQQTNIIKQLVTSNSYIFASIDKYSSVASTELQTAQTNADGTITTASAGLSASGLSTLASPVAGETAAQINALQASLTANMGSAPTTIQQMYQSIANQAITAATNGITGSATGITLPTATNIQSSASALGTQASTTATSTSGELLSDLSSLETQEETTALTDGVSSANTEIATANTDANTYLNTASTDASNTVLPYITQTSSGTNAQGSTTSASGLSVVAIPDDSDSDTSSTVDSSGTDASSADDSNASTSSSTAAAPAAAQDSSDALAAYLSQ